MDEPLPGMLSRSLLTSSRQNYVQGLSLTKPWREARTKPLSFASGLRQEPASPRQNSDWQRVRQVLQNQGLVNRKAHERGSVVPRGVGLVLAPGSFLPYSF